MSAETSSRFGTFVQLSVNTDHSSFTKYRDDQKRSIIVVLAKDGIEKQQVNDYMRAYMKSIGQEHTTGSSAFVVQASKPFRMLLSRLFDLNYRTLVEIGEMALQQILLGGTPTDADRVLQVSVLPPQLPAPGTPSFGGEWLAGFELYGREITQRTISPRTLWVGVAAHQDPDAVLTALGDFVFTDCMTDGELIVEVTATSVARSSSLTVVVYGTDRDTTTFRYYPVDTQTLNFSTKGDTRRFTVPNPPPGWNVLITAGIGALETYTVRVGGRFVAAT